MLKFEKETNAMGDGRKQVKFTFTEPDGTRFTDAHYFDPEAHAAMAERDIDLMCCDRFNRWKQGLGQEPTATLDNLSRPGAAALAAAVRGALGISEAPATLQ